jgi:uncharacterized protein with ParB-like and HNH nuclease domain
MSTNLDYDLFNVKNLFRENHYVVPRYQRGYAWLDEQVNNLLEDLDLAFDEAPDEDYLLGQIIVCPSDTPVKLAGVGAQWDLIDGQQRTTTLYLMMLYIYQRLAKIDPESRSFSDWRLLSTHEDKDLEVAKVTPASNGHLVLDALINRKALPKADSPTSTNLVSAWNQICEFLDTFSDQRFESFIKYFGEKVVVIRLQLEDAKHALRIFSRVNNRGLVLDESDIIKNFLFQSVSDQEFDNLSESWNDAANALNGSRLKRTKDMDFLLKLKAGILTGRSISTRNLFDTFAPTSRSAKKDFEDVALLNTPQKVKDFARSLPINAKMIKQLSQNNVEQLLGYDDNSHFSYLRKVVQHFEVLLAGSHLTETAYSHLNRIVQDRMVLAVLSKTVKEFERDVHPWAKLVSQLDVNPTKEELVLTARNAGVLQDLDTLFDTAFIRINSLRYTTQTHQEILRYILARASKVHQDRIDSIKTDMKTYMRTSGKSGDSLGFDLDHIFPQSRSQFSNFPKPSDWNDLSDEAKTSFESKYVHSIGNLSLLHPRDNRDQSDALPNSSQKIENYLDSELYINRLLAKSDDVSSSRHQKQIDELGLERMPTMSDWNSEAIDLRADLIWGIVKKDILGSFGLDEPA